VTLLAAGAPTDELVLVSARCGDAAEDAGSGLLAEQLVAAFAEARDGVASLERGGSVLFRVSGGPAARAGFASLTRTLALEWAPMDVRVNTVFGDGDCDCDCDCDDLVRFLSGAASRMLTGAVIDAA
jgi:hypothetical protein